MGKEITFDKFIRFKDFLKLGENLPRQTEVEELYKQASIGLDDGSGRLGLGALGLISSALALNGTLACGLLGSKTGTTLGKGLLLGGRGSLGGILIRIGIIVGSGGLLRLDRGRRGLAHRIDNLGLNNGRHLFLRLAELTDGTADRAAHLRELIRAKQQKAEDHDDRELTLSNTKHTYLQGSM